MKSCDNYLLQDKTIWRLSPSNFSKANLLEKTIKIACERVTSTAPISGVRSGLGEA